MCVSVWEHVCMRQVLWRSEVLEPLELETPVSHLA